jgi:Domain of Unknown Function (DUF930)
MPPLFHSTPVTMRDDNRDQRWVFRRALPASLVLHLVIAALLIFGLPVSLSQPQKEQAMEVDLVPPPKPSAKAAVEPSPPMGESKPEKSERANVEKSSPTSNDAARHEPSPSVRPVFKFGEKDAGPRRSPAGNSAEDNSEPPTALRNPNKQDVAKPPALTAAEATKQTPQPAPGIPAPEMPAAEMPAPKKAAAANVQSALKLHEAKTLFSQAATGDPIATTAMGGVPRGVRAGRLCLTELREQLLHALPPFFPDILPSQGLNNGTIIEIPNAAFRADRQWYNLSFRCEVDTDATKVMSFAFNVGGPVPPSEWKRRGLPSQ